MKKTNLISIALLSMILLISCGKTQKEKMSDYFELSPGFWIKYDSYQLDSLSNKVSQKIIDSSFVGKDTIIEGKKAHILTDIYLLAQPIINNQYLFVDDSTAWYYESVSTTKKVWTKYYDLFQETFESNEFNFIDFPFDATDPTVTFTGSVKFYGKKSTKKDTVIKEKKTVIQDFSYEGIWTGTIMVSGEARSVKLSIPMTYKLAKGIGLIYMKMAPHKNLIGYYPAKGFELIMSDYLVK